MITFFQRRADAGIIDIFASVARNMQHGYTWNMATSPPLSTKMRFVFIHFSTNHNEPMRHKRILSCFCWNTPWSPAVLWLREINTEHSQIKRNKTNEIPPSANHKNGEIIVHARLVLLIVWYSRFRRFECVQNGENRFNSNGSSLEFGVNQSTMTTTLCHTVSTLPGA